MGLLIVWSPLIYILIVGALGDIYTNQTAGSIKELKRYRKVKPLLKARGVTVEDLRREIPKGKVYYFGVYENEEALAKRLQLKERREK